MTDRIVEITARCYEGRPNLRIDMKYLLSQLAEQDKEIERLQGAQEQAINILQQIEWVGGGAKGLIEDAITAICGQSIPGKRMTNGDRMRATSDEELAKVIRSLEIAEIIPFCKNKPECVAILNDTNESIPESMCVECVLDWLRQPAEEEHYEDD